MSHVFLFILEVYYYAEFVGVFQKIFLEFIIGSLYTSIMYTFAFQTEGITWHHAASACILQIPFLALWSSITAISEILSCKSQKWGKIEFLGGIPHEGQLRDQIFTVILTCPEWLDLHS